MKKLLIIILATAYLTSCNHDSDVEPIGTWKVSYYVDSGKNETADFAGYTFEFQTGGKFIAKLAGATYTGTWNENSSSKKLDIKIAGTNKLDDVSDDWLILEKTSTSIKLKDDNSSSNEELHLVKN